MNLQCLSDSSPTACGIACTLLLFVSGCGQGADAPQLVSVTGKVLKNGDPVTAGAINFYPANSNDYTKDKPSSLLQTDGSFMMKTYPFGEGVPPGKYKVTLAPELASRLKKNDYAYPEKTPWEIEINNQDVKNVLFDLE
ncbi:MAG: hypothetical protein ABIK07_07265 [Planctomycetota bacterium]